MTTHFPQHLSAAEARIINRLITSILRAGYVISVCDEGGAFGCVKQSDRATIQREVAATDFTLLHVWQPLNGGYAKVGSMALAHGNDEDVISDYGWHPQVPGLQNTFDALVEHATA